MKTNETILSAHIAKEVSKTSSQKWMDRRNNLLSSMMEETVTNRQMCLISNFTLSSICTIGAGANSLLLGLLAFGWMVSAYHLMKKGGMTYDK